MFENSWADVWTSYDTIIVCGMLKWNENILTFLWWCYISLSRRRSIYIRKMCVNFCCEWRLMTDERKIKQNNFSIYFDLECDAKYLCVSSCLAYLLNLRTVLVFLHAIQITNAFGYFLSIYLGCYCMCVRKGARGVNTKFFTSTFIDFYNLV